MAAKKANGKKRVGATKEIAMGVTRAGTTALATAIVRSDPTMSTGTAVAVASGLAFVSTLVGLAYDAINQRSATRWTTWLDAYLDDLPTVDPKLIEAQLHAESEDPMVQELIIENARLIGEALADQVVPAMARLTRTYRKEKRPADRFFRGMRRLLSDLTTEEFADLRELLTRVTDPSIPQEATWLEVEWRPGRVDGAPYSLQGSVVAFGMGGHSAHGDYDLGTGLRDPMRLFHVLQINGLAGTGTMRLGGSLPASALFELETTRRIRSVID